MDPRFEVIADCYRWGTDEAGAVIFHPGSSADRQSGYDGNHLFVEDLERAISQVSKCVDENRRRSIFEKLAYAETMKHFDSMSFRSYLLLHWQQMADDFSDKFKNAPSPEDHAEIVRIREQLSDSAVTVADEIVGDFASAFVRPHLVENVRNSVDLRAE